MFSCHRFVFSFIFAFSIGSVAFADLRERERGDGMACPTGEVDPSALQAKQNEMRTRYGIEVDFKPVYPAAEKVVYEEIPAEKMILADYYLDLAIAELDALPPEFLRTANVKSFAYAMNPTSEGDPVEGLALFETHQVLFNVSDEDCTKDPIVGTLHHELFHMYHNIPEPPSFETAAWNVLNEFGFQYVPEGEKETKVNHPKPGFVSEYAMTDEGEDSAETYAAMMIGRYARRIKTWMKTDEVLAKKVDFIKGTLAKTSGAYTEEYWQAIEASGYR